MKKVYSLALAVLFAASAFAYEQIGQLNPYAYAVNGQSRAGKIAVSYNLNAPADSTIIAIYKDGVEVGKQIVNDNDKGLHSAVVDITGAYTAGGKYTVGIRVYGTSYDAPFQLKEIKDGSTDTTALCYKFYHPKGVDIDVDPFSPNFGRILTNEAMQDTPDEGYHSSTDKDGIYAFDPTFQPIANGNNRAFKGGLEFGVRMSDGSTRAYTPYRIRISKDGRIFTTMQDDTRSPLYELSADLQTWTPIFNGSMVEGVISDADGNYISGINCGLEVIGEGENLEIIMLNMNTTGFASYHPKDWMVAHYKIGTNTVWNGAATSATPLVNYIDTFAVPVAASAGIAVDDKGGFWFHSARANMIDQRGLCHVNAAGAVDFEFHKTAADSAKYNIATNGSNGGAGCRVINMYGDDYLFVGMGRIKTNTVGRMVVYKIIYDANGGVSDLETIYDEHLAEISTNLNDFAMDFAHNLYTVGNSNEMIIPVALPYSGVVETPVAAEVIVEALNNVDGEMNVQKFVENGQVVIVKDGVKYNMLGAVVK